MLTISGRYTPFNRIQSTIWVLSKTYTYPYRNMHGRKDGGRGEAKISAVKKPETRKKGPNWAGRMEQGQIREPLVWDLFPTVKKGHRHISLPSSALSYLKDFREIMPFIIIAP